jgi:hypothetical protein
VCLRESATASAANLSSKHIVARNGPQDENCQAEGRSGDRLELVGQRSATFGLNFGPISKLMTDLITEEITGRPVAVTIGKGRFCLSYPLHNILLFKKQTGLSLFDKKTWDQLDFEENYEAWIACLWAGLHYLGEHGWQADVVKADLERNVGFHNAPALHGAMFEALTNWMPKKEPEDAEKKTELTMPLAPMPAAPSTTSPASGSVHNADLDSLESNS